MKESLYYLNLSSLPDGEALKDSRLSIKRDILVNCAGSINTPCPHICDAKSGRADYYMIYIAEGNLLFNSCGKKVYLAPFDAIILPPNTPYLQELDKNENLNYLWVHFTGGEVENILCELGIKKFPHVNKVAQNNHLQTRFQRLFDCFIKKDEFMERDLRASLEKLLIELARASKTSDKPRISLSKSISYINNYYNTHLKIPDLAQMDGISMTQYNLHFKKQMGMAPTKYIISLRMKLAKELIETSNLSLTQISFMCGYEDYNFFAKVFKSYTGISPKKFRKI